MAGEIAKHFEKLFTSDQPGDCAEVLDGIPRTISELMNRNLTRAVEDHEVKKALFSMNPNKAPKPNRMTPSFYQQYWHIIGPDICLAVKAFFILKVYYLL